MDDATFKLLFTEVIVRNYDVVVLMEVIDLGIPQFAADFEWRLNLYHRVYMGYTGAGDGVFRVIQSPRLGQNNVGRGPAPVVGESQFVVYRADRVTPLGQYMGESAGYLVPHLDNVFTTHLDQPQFKPSVPSH